MDEAPGDPVPWWGSVSLSAYEGGRWDVGPSTFWVYRSSHDWRVVHRPSTTPVTADPMAQRSAVTVPLDVHAMTAVLEDDDLHMNRYSVRQTNEAVVLRPARADRSVVSRPEHALAILPDEAVTLYLSTSLWVRIELVESERRLEEGPSHRMADTWFGPSTREGELCYATRTVGRLRLDKVPVRLHRALTPLQVRNRVAEPLALERVQLSAPYLALYATSEDVLWTQAVTMIHREDGEGAAVKIEEGPPADAGEATLMQEPRIASRRGLFTSTFGTFGALFGP